MFANFPGAVGVIATDVGLIALVWPGVLFMYSTVPYRKSRSSIIMLIVLLSSIALYVVVLNGPTSWNPALVPLAATIGFGPLVVALAEVRTLRHAYRWILIALFIALATFLLIFQNRTEAGPGIALNALLFAVYFGCCLHFWIAFRKYTAGAIVTITGFGAWALVFAVGPWIIAHVSNMTPGNEVWNLPKYVVAVGMILLLFEGQLEHSKYLALHDELTGLPNRRLFLDRLSIALERARRAGTKAALLVVDLDHFKRVNDTLGHHAGDTILRQVGTIFSSRVRRSDTVARTGGDEFCVILEEPTNRAQARQVAHSLMLQLNQPQKVDGHTIWVGASVGIAIFPDDAGDIESLCIAADLRMYSDKRGTVNNVEQIDSKAHAPISTHNSSDGIEAS
ncbi:MAG: GGDEF domain-containing protein [Acidobacteriota bacterium]|nr:GGDEF domain-containing protein [Acidobacteriota bacterium]